MSYRKYLITTFLVSLFAGLATAQATAEFDEQSPEAMDAAFTEADAQREAAGWSEETVERSVEDPVARMSASADLVVRATVTDQEVVYDANDVPFTRTTLSIGEVLEGKYPDSLITVVQEGGPAKNKPENVLMLSHTHYFTQGQEELLFLELNPASPHSYSQVVIKKRFGVLNGQLFNEDGRGLIYTPAEDSPGYKLSLSRDRNPHPRFREITIGSHQFTKQFREREPEAESPGQVTSRSKRESRPGYQASVEIETFKQLLNGEGG